MFRRRYINSDYSDGRYINSDLASTFINFATEGIPSEAGVLIRERAFAVRAPVEKGHSKWIGLTIKGLLVDRRVLDH